MVRRDTMEWREDNTGIHLIEQKNKSDHTQVSTKKYKNHERKGHQTNLIYHIHVNTEFSATSTWYRHQTVQNLKAWNTRQ